MILRVNAYKCCANLCAPLCARMVLTWPILFISSITSVCFVHYRDLETSTIVAFVAFVAFCDSLAPNLVFLGNEAYFLFRHVRGVCNLTDIHFAPSRREMQIWADPSSQTATCHETPMYSSSVILRFDHRIRRCLDPVCEPRSWQAEFPLPRVVTSKTVTSRILIARSCHKQFVIWR